MWQPFHGVLIVGFYFLTTWYLETFNADSNELWNWTCWYKIAWIFPTFYTLVSFMGLVLPDSCSSQSHSDQQQQPGTKIKLCIVSKGTNIEALQRTLQSLQWFDKEAQHLNLFLVIDEGCHVIQIQNIVQTSNLPIHLVVVPTCFITQHARYKSRALEYFRLHHVHNDDWILHMDEESTIDFENFQKCLAFARENKYDVGQGVIYYNSFHYNLWTFTSKLITVADALRVSDDLCRFRLQYFLIHRPIFGLHGSFLMIRGAVENKVTWDHKYAGNLTEDYAFGMQTDSNVTYGPIHGVVREVSPQSMRDFAKQRRRWLLGILTLPYFWPRFMGALWMMGSFTFVATYLHVILSLVWFYVFDSLLPVTPMWLGALSTVSFVIPVYMYAIGLLIQHLDYLYTTQRGWLYSVGYIVGHFLLAIPLFVCGSVLETVCIYYSLVTRPKTFDVVRK